MDGSITSDNCLLAAVQAEVPAALIAELVFAKWRDCGHYVPGKTAVMELAPGIHSSSSATDDWLADDDPPGEVHLLVDEAGLQAGFWRPVPGVTPNLVHWKLPAREVISVVRGQAHLHIEGGPELDLGPGSVAALPAGAHITWQVSPDYLEFWVLVSAH